jgi:nicotinate-nucleotide adenylyltransferase
MANLINDILSPKPVKLRIGLFFGSFNPIHIGHLAIANYMVEFTPMDQVWFVVSPQNPLKNKTYLLDSYQRLEIVHRAVDDDIRFRVSNIEFKLPKPSYTSDTLAYLGEQFPNHTFSLIMGSDNLESFHRWKNYEVIAQNHELYIYPRPGLQTENSKSFSNVILTQAPQIDISSTFIRSAIREGKNMACFIPKKAWEYIDEMNFYKK